MRTIEQIDEQFLRRLVGTRRSCAIEQMYLELGFQPARFVIQSRRINFLHYILNENENSLIFQILNTQLESPNKGDWGQKVTNDLRELGLGSIGTIKNMKRNTLKAELKTTIEDKSFSYLMNFKSKHKKAKLIRYEKLTMQDYLISNNTLSIKEEKSYV